MLSAVPQCHNIAWRHESGPVVVPQWDLFKIQISYCFGVYPCFLAHKSKPQYNIMCLTLLHTGKWGTTAAAMVDSMMISDLSRNPNVTRGEMEGRISASWDEGKFGDRDQEERVLFAAWQSAKEIAAKPLHMARSAP